MAGSTAHWLSVGLSMNNTKFKKGLASSQKQLTGFQKSIRSIGGMMAGAFAIGAVTRFAKSAFQALDTQRKAEYGLLTALKGKVDVQQRLIQQARELQKVTLYGDEETIRAQSLIAAFVKEESTIRRIIPLVQDLAAAKQMDLAGAADLVSKTLGSSTNALSRYGIEVTGAVGSSERLLTLARGLSDAFEGQAKAMAEADTQLTQWKNKIGDLKEVMAGLVLEIGPAFKDMVSMFSSKAIGGWDKFMALFSPAQLIAMEAYNEALLEMGEGWNKVKDAEYIGNAMADAMKAMGSAGEVTAPIIKEVVKEAEKAFTISQKMRALQNSAIRDARGQGPSGSPLDEWVGGEMEDITAGIEEFADVAKMKLPEAESQFSSLNATVVGFASSMASSIGSAIGNMDNFGDALQALGTMIFDALGNILIMVGMSTTPMGIPLILAGLGLKLGAGIIGGLGSRGGATMQPQAVQSGNEVQFRIEGTDLVGVLNRHNTNYGYKT